jgi:uncharacterized caspase-like protein
VSLALAGFAQEKPKPSGASCIAIENPSVQGTPGNATDASTGVRDLIASYLTGPALKVVSLEAKLPSQAAEEAKAKGCEPVLVASLTRKAKGNKGFMNALGQAANTASWRLPAGGTAGSAAAQAAGAAGLQTVATLAQSTKAKDEVKLEYRLESAGGRIVFGPRTEHQTAKVDGEDLLTPVVMRAAEAIVSSQRTGRPAQSPAAAEEKPPAVPR